MPDLNTEPAEVSLEPAAVESETLSSLFTAPIRKSMIPELYRFVRGLPADAPYDQLGAMVQSAGWIWRLVERSTTSTPFGSYLVQFDVYIGKATADLELEYFDMISMSVPAEAPSPSLIARLNAQVALAYMVFGRLPPVQQPMPVQQPEPTFVPAPAPEPVEEAPWRENRTPPKPRRQPVPDNLIRERTMDGLPIVINLYELDVDTHEGVDRIIALFEDEAERLTDVGQLRALYTVNKEDTVGAVQYVQDFATPEQTERLHTLFRRREQLLSRRR